MFIYGGPEIRMIWSVDLTSYYCIDDIYIGLIDLYLSNDNDVLQTGSIIK